MGKNVVLMSDSYKYSHWKQYPEGTEYVFDYLESRGGKYPVTQFFGLQAIIKKYLTRAITKADVDSAKLFIDKHIGKGVFNYDGWMHIVNEHNGKLPVKIRAVKEGSIVPNSNVLVTVENTDPKCYWLTGHLETMLMRVWAPTTVATTSLVCRTILDKYLEATGSSEEQPFKVHDFGARGVSSSESCEFNAAAHLINHMGTDSVEGITFLMEYYNCTDMPAFSVPAAEHSTMTFEGKEGEYKQMDRITDQFKDFPIVSVVSDSYNLYAALDYWIEQKDKLKEQGTTLVVRPDSGNPVKMALDVVAILSEGYGYVVNDKGYKVIDGARVLYGDGISSPGVIAEIYQTLKENGYSADNLVVGMGGGLLQKNDRDTQKFAIKCSHGIVNGEERDVYKDPITDSGKKSKRGKICLYRCAKESEVLYATSSYTEDPEFKINASHATFTPCMQTVFENGELRNEQSFEDIKCYGEEEYQLQKEFLRSWLPF
jgi:nicotinamide phosphoribosyltransferase